MSSEPGRQTRHSFSFGASYDPERVSFGPLIALNDDVLGTGAGYDVHEHADVVLVTWVVSGTLEHRDASGTSTQGAGDLAITRAGTGITHSERAAGGVTRFVQAWLRPEEAGGEPSRRVTTPDLSDGDLATVATADDLSVPGATLRIAELPRGASAKIPAAALCYVFVSSGALARSSLAEPLAAGDAFEIRDEPARTVTAAVDTQLLVWSFAE
ncbi:MAG: pirin family protein [Nocardioides sp.]|nr:pirin family protein [Nocardioides sp.]